MSCGIVSRHDIQIFIHGLVLGVELGRNRDIVFLKMGRRIMEENRWKW